MNNLQKYAAKQAIIIKLAESEAIENLKGDDRSFLGSRTYNNPLSYGAILGGLGAGLGSAYGPRAAAAMGLGWGLGGAGGMALNRILQARAQRGRAAMGQKSSGSEAQVLEALRQSGDKSGTNPISRALTSPLGGGLLGGAYGAALGRKMGKPKIAPYGFTLHPGNRGKTALLGGLIGAGLGAGGAKLQRIIAARAAKGRANTGQSGLGELESDQAVIDALRKAKA